MAEVVIAARGGPKAKSRLSALLGPTARAALTRAMLRDMLGALARCPDVRRVWLVTPTADLAAIAKSAAAEVIQTGARLNDAFELGLAAVQDTAPYARVLLLPGDLPLLARADVEAVLKLLETHEIVLVPALEDGGTGAIALRAGVSFTPCFGAHSFVRHRREAERRGLKCAVVESRSLGIDLDRPADIPVVAREGAGTRTAWLLAGDNRYRSTP
ncbi:MAG: 2-phospho-L-lactate guanylyltransferase [Parcubacteria group bacterium]